MRTSESHADRSRTDGASDQAQAGARDDGVQALGRVLRAGLLAFVLTVGLGLALVVLVDGPEAWHRWLGSSRSLVSALAGVLAGLSFCQLLRAWHRSWVGPFWQGLRCLQPTALAVLAWILFFLVWRSPLIVLFLTVTLQVYVRLVGEGRAQVFRGALLDPVSDLDAPPPAHLPAHPVCACRVCGWPAHRVRDTRPGPLWMVAWRPEASLSFIFRGAGVLAGALLVLGLGGMVSKAARDGSLDFSMALDLMVVTPVAWILAALVSFLVLATCSAARWLFPWPARAGYCCQRCGSLCFDLFPVEAWPRSLGRFVVALCLFLFLLAFGHWQGRNLAVPLGVSGFLTWGTGGTNPRLPEWVPDHSRLLVGRVRLAEIACRAPHGESLQRPSHGRTAEAAEQVAFWIPITHLIFRQGDSTVDSLRVPLRIDGTVLWPVSHGTRELSLERIVLRSGRVLSAVGDGRLGPVSRGRLLDLGEVVYKRRFRFSRDAVVHHKVSPRRLVLGRSLPEDGLFFAGGMPYRSLLEDDASGVPSWARRLLEEDRQKVMELRTLGNQEVDSLHGLASYCETFPEDEAALLELGRGALRDARNGPLLHSLAPGGALTGRLTEEMRLRIWFAHGLSRDVEQGIAALRSQGDELPRSLREMELEVLTERGRSREVWERLVNWTLEGDDRFWRRLEAAAWQVGDPAVLRAHVLRWLEEGEGRYRCEAPKVVESLLRGWLLAGSPELAEALERRWEENGHEPWIPELPGLSSLPPPEDDPFWPDAFCEDF